MNNRGKISSNTPTLNVWQAVVGAFAGYLLIDFADAVLSSTSIYFFTISLDFFKYIFIVGILLYIAVLASAVNSIQSGIHQFTARSSIGSVLNWTRGIFIALFLLYSFMITTYFLVPTAFNKYKFILFALIWPLWIGNFFSDNFRDHRLFKSFKQNDTTSSTSTYIRIQRRDRAAHLYLLRQVKSKSSPKIEFAFELSETMAGIKFKNTKNISTIESQNRNNIHLLVRKW